MKFLELPVYLNLEFHNSSLELSNDWNNSFQLFFLVVFA